MSETPPADILAALDRMQLLHGAAPSGRPLAGGVSSNIWRIDLPTPVEYITTDTDRDRVRNVARRLLAGEPARLADVARAWHEEIT